MGKRFSCKNRNLFFTYAEVIDSGEASAIALAAEVTSLLLILDDLKGRKLADQLTLSYTGSIGVLVSAKQNKVIPFLKPYFEKIRFTNFRIPQSFLQDLQDKYDR